MSDRTGGATDDDAIGCLVRVSRPAGPASAIRLSELLAEYGLADVVDLAASTTTRAEEAFIGIGPLGVCGRYTLSPPVVAAGGGDVADTAGEVELKLVLEHPGADGRFAYGVVRLSNVDDQATTVARIVVSDVDEPSGQLPRAVVHRQDDEIAQLSADEQVHLAAALDKFTAAYDAKRDAISPPWLESLLVQIIDAAGGVLVAGGSIGVRFLPSAGQATLDTVRRIATELTGAVGERIVAAVPVTGGQADLMALVAHAARNTGRGEIVLGTRRDEVALTDGAGPATSDVIGYLVLRDIGAVYSAPTIPIPRAACADLLEYVNQPTVVGEVVDDLMEAALAVPVELSGDDIMVIARDGLERAVAAQRAVRSAAGDRDDAHFVILAVTRDSEFARVVTEAVRSDISLSIRRLEFVVRLELRQRTAPSAVAVAGWRDESDEILTRIDRYRDVIPADALRELTRAVEDLRQRIGYSETSVATDA